MLKAKIEELKDFILENNPYFSTGFSMVYMDNVRGWVANERDIVFPNDTLGNYFYIRLEDDMKFDRGNYYNVGDGLVNAGIRATLYLVAVMKGADADTLLNNIISTIQQSPCSVQGVINFSGAIYESEAVIERELRKLPEADRRKALQNNKSTIVSVKFDMTTTFVPTKLNCIQNPSC